jgi:hypothetical protein
VSQQAVDVAFAGFCAGTVSIAFFIFGLRSS